MAIDYLRDVKEMEDAGSTDLEIAQHLANKTESPIPCGAAKVVLEESGLVVEDPITLQRSGTLVDRYNAMTDPELKALLGWFMSHVFGRGEQISSASYPRAVQLAAVLADLPPALQTVGQQLLALGGGQPFTGTVEADVVAARQVYQDEQAEVARQDSIRALQAEIENTWINPAVSDGSTTAESLRATIKAGL